MNQSGNKFEGLLRGIQRQTRLPDAFKAGATPDDVKQDVIILLSPFFSNKDVLEKAAVNVLMSDAIALTNLSRNNLAYDLFEYAWTIHQQAYTQDANACILTSVEWQPAIFNGMSVFWSQYYLEADKTDLQDEEFLHECLHNVGAITEGVIKPLSKELLQQQWVKNGDYAKKSSIKDLDFGIAIDDLHRASPNPNFFAPWGVRLSQWRNIAQHFSASVEDGTFICKYGHPEREIRLSRAELYNVTRHIFDMFSSLQLANTFFTVDHMIELRNAGLTPQSMKMRYEMEILHLVSGLASQGFDVVDFQNDESGAKLVIKDMTNLDPDKRRFHTVQFVWLLWYCTKASIVTVEYLQQDGTPNFRTQAPAELFTRIEKEQLPAEVIAEESELTDLKANLGIPRFSKSSQGTV